MISLSSYLSFLILLSNCLVVLACKPYPLFVSFTSKNFKIFDAVLNAIFWFSISVFFHCLNIEIQVNFYMYLIVCNFAQLMCSSSFLIDSIGISTGVLMPSVNRVLLLPLQFGFLLFLFLISLCWLGLHYNVEWTEDPGGLQLMGSQRVGYHLATK